MFCSSRHSAFLLVISCILFPLAAEAHKLNVFAYVEQDRVNVEAYFRSGAKAQDTTILVCDIEGNVLLRTKTDSEGVCSFLAPATTNLRIVASTADGHRAEYLLPKEELTVTDAPLKRPVSMSEIPSNSRELQLQVEQLQRSVNQLRKDLAQANDAVTVQDVVTGIAFIIGLTGGGAYILSRRSRNRTYDS